MAKPFKDLRVGDKYCGIDENLWFNATVVERLEDTENGYVSITIEVTRPRLEHLTEKRYNEHLKRSV